MKKTSNPTKNAKKNPGRLTSAKQQKRRKQREKKMTDKNGNQKQKKTPDNENCRNALDD